MLKSCIAQTYISLEQLVKKFGGGLIQTQEFKVQLLLYQ